MYRFLLAPKWIGFHLLVIVAIVTMINLGFWQLRRLDQRQDFNAIVESRYDAPAQPIDEVVRPGVEPDDVEWRPVIATGTFLPDETIRIVNRAQNGRPGDNVVVPLRLDDGRLLLVNRGFVPLGSEVPAPPAGEVTVTGRLRPPEDRRLGQLSDPEQGELREAQRVDIERLAPQLDGEVLPLYVDAVETDPADDPAVQPVARPDVTDGPHLSYAVQWFTFSVAVAVGWVLAVRRSVQTRRRALTQPAPEAASASSQP